MRRFDDIDPMNIDPDTNAPYANYSSPSLDTSFHDGEMDVDDESAMETIERELTGIVKAIERGESWATHRSRFKELEAQLADIGADQ